MEQPTTESTPAPRRRGPYGWNTPHDRMRARLRRIRQTGMGQLPPAQFMNRDEYDEAVALFHALIEETIRSLQASGRLTSENPPAQ